MTSERFMLRRRAAFSAAALAFALSLAITGCQALRPGSIVLRSDAPYSASRELIWAVAPLINESGTSLVDELAVSDMIANELMLVRGISALPLNRSLAAMRALRLAAITTEAEALALARTLGADAILVGTITSWDPYDPPQLGINIALYSRSPDMMAGARFSGDPQLLSMASTDSDIRHDWGGPGPLAAIAGFYDASDTLTQRAMQHYARSKPEDPSALGWRRFSASMKLFTKFVCHELVGEVLASERARVSVLAGVETREPPR